VGYTIASSIDVTTAKITKGAEALLWKSDYTIPTNEADPFSYYSKARISYHTEARADKGDIGYVQHMLSEQYSGTLVPDAKLYIYGLNFRRNLLRELTRIKTTYLDSLNSSDTFFIKTNRTETNSSEQTEAALEKTDLYVNGSFRATLFDYSNANSMSSIIYTALLLLPTFPTSKSDFMMVAGPILSAISGSINSTDSEILCFPWFLSVSTEGDGILVGKRIHYADFSVNKAYYSSQTSFAVSDSLIPALQNGTIFGGHIYSIQSQIRFGQMQNGYAIDNISACSVSNPEQLLPGDKTLCQQLTALEKRWFKFTAKQNATYSFTSKNSRSITGQFFPSIVSDDSTSGLLAENQGGNGDGFSIDMTLTASQTIYLRLQSQVATVPFIISLTPGSLSHVHSYCLNPTYYSSSFHKAFCRCGEYVLKPHKLSEHTQVRNGRLYSTCTECHTTIDLGSTGRGIVG
jgi:hypothetical protein